MEIPPGTKFCIGCRQTFGLSHFYPSKGGHSSRCRSCFKTQGAERQQRNRRKYHAYLREQSCLDCGVKDPIVLTHDHRDPSKKLMKVSQMISHYSWKKIMQEVAKCDVVCANCHAKRTAKQQGWYK